MAILWPFYGSIINKCFHISETKLDTNYISYIYLLLLHTIMPYAERATTEKVHPKPPMTKLRFGLKSKIDAIMHDPI